VITVDDVKTLLKQTGAQDTLSLYLNVDNAERENQTDPPAWRIWLKRTLSEVARDANEAVWLPIHARALSYFEHYSPASKGIVAFIGGDWEETFPLPVTIENQSGFGDLLIEPLLRILSQYKPYLVVQVSREEAHFYISFLGQTAFEDSREIDLEAYDFAQKTLMPATAAMGSGGQGGVTQGSNRDAFENMIEEHRARFYRDVVDYTQKLTRINNIERVILGGSAQAAHAVHNLMPRALRNNVLEIVSLPGKYTAKEIFAHVQPQALAHEHERANMLVSEVIDMARAGGRAALGLEAVQHALNYRQVDTLLLSEQLPDRALANDLARWALSVNSNVEIMHGDAAGRLLDEGDGVAAKLYYSM